MASSILIQDDICGEVDEDQEDDNAYDIYNFAFTQKTVTIQEMTNTQKIVLSQKSRGRLINPNWILLDSQSTIKILNNPKLFSSIRDCNDHEVVRCYCNGGYQDTQKISIVPGIGEVYFNPNSLADIILVSDIDNEYRTTYDSDREKAFIVHNTSIGINKFIRSKNGLHYYDIRLQRNKCFTLLQSVDDNKINFTRN